MPTTKKESLSTCTKEVLSSSKDANSSFKVIYKDGTEAYRLHKTDVVTINTDGSVVLNSDGWKTNTTKDRMHSYAYNYGIRISQTKGLWYVTTAKGTFDYFDGIRIESDGTVKKQHPVNLKKVDAIKKQISDYCKLITDDNLPKPDGGDCFYCAFTTKEGATMGDLSNSDHLKSHLKEKYLVGSLLVNSMREAGYRDEQIAVHYSLKISDTFRRAVRKYLTKRLIK